jgi:hypothetical protein
LTRLPHGFSLVDCEGNAIKPTEPPLPTKTIDEQEALSIELSRLNLNEAKYSVGMHKDNALVIVNAHTSWVVYFSEGLLVKSLEKFATFNNAKAHFLSELRNRL